MDPVGNAVAILSNFLRQHDIRFMLVGGMANAVWGQVRATTDADFVLSLGEQHIADVVTLLSTQFKPLKPNPLEFAKRTYVIPIRVTDEVTADLSLAMLPYEQQALERAVEIDIGDARVPVCSAEDLIIYKAISEREKDWLDIEGVLMRQNDKLDQKYIAQWLDEFAEALERPALVARYNALRAQVSRARRKRK